MDCRYACQAGQTRLYRSKRPPIDYVELVLALPGRSLDLYLYDRLHDGGDVA